MNDAVTDTKLVNRRTTFTVKRLLPGGWIDGEIINFCLDSWQPPVAEGVVLLDTYFWPARLKYIESVDDEQRWRHVFDDPVLQVRS